MFVMGMEVDMTIDKFNMTGFYGGMFAIYSGERYARLKREMRLNLKAKG